MVVSFPYLSYPLVPAELGGSGHELNRLLSPPLTSEFQAYSAGEVLRQAQPSSSLSPLLSAPREQKYLLSALIIPE